mgnify:FL=1
MSQEAIDFGDGHTGEWLGWRPDRKLNPQYAHLPDVERCTLIVYHSKPDGSPCSGAITVVSPVNEAVFPGRPKWQMVQEEPLTLTPSLLCSCGDHGFITNGKWVRA